VKLNIGEEIELTIIDLNDQGQGVSKHESQVIFIPNVLIGDHVLVRIIKFNKNIYHAVVIKKIKEAKTSELISCPYYNECGGCHLSHMSYGEQLLFKQNKVKKIMKKFANLDQNIEILPSVNQFNYRNKVTLKVKGNQLGYYQLKTHQLIAIEECQLLDSQLNQLIDLMKQFINKYPNNNIEEIVIKTTKLKQSMVIIKSNNFKLKSLLIDFIKNSSITIDSLYVNDHLVLGKQHIEEIMLNKKILISNQSFFQVNYETAIQIFEYINQLIKPDIMVLDLYSGTGIIAGVISDKVKQVTGIEVIESAYLDAEAMAKNNKIDNADFIKGDVDQHLNKIKELDVDLVIVDPPRKGLSTGLTNQLNKLAIKDIIYISCDPITLARDIKLLDNYRVVSMASFDMFPQTYHVETVVKLSKI